jgi:hypothetical protein
MVIFREMGCFLSGVNNTLSSATTSTEITLFFTVKQYLIKFSVFDLLCSLLNAWS